MGSTTRGADPSGGRSALELHEHQVDIWKQIIFYRYFAVAALGVLALLPVAGDNHWTVAFILLGLALPFNGLNDLWLRRTGQLRPWVAFTDQLLVISVIALDPALLYEGFVTLVAVNATNAVSFGRRVAYPAGAIGAVGITAVALYTGGADMLLLSACFVVSSGFSVTVAGRIAEVEQEVRGQYAELMSGIDVIVWEQITTRPSTLAVNGQAENVLGYPVARWREPHFWRDHVHPDDVEEAARAYRDATRRGQNLDLEYRMISADGRIVHMHDRMRVETDSFGKAIHVRGVMLDVSAEREARAQADQYVNLVESIRLAMFVFGLRDPSDDDSLELLAINPEAAMVSGLHVEGAVGQLAVELLRIPEADRLIADLADVVRTNAGFDRDDFRLDTRPEARIYNAHAFALPGNAVALSLDDVTERAMAADVLRRQALHDGLTGLPNRTSLNDRLRIALRHSKQTSKPVGLLIMDLDQFKEVNDALGHDHGDRLLIEISRRLQRVLPGADLIARLGGDEFAVLLTECNEERAVAAAESVRHTFERPFQLGGITLQTNASIGIALSPAHAIDAESLAQKADVAMYAAKRGGLGFSLYAPEHDLSSVRRLALLAELRTAINEDQLVLHYQPTLALGAGLVEGVEALVRWQHPDHGLMPPAEFIELAELSGMIQALTRWVLDHALTQIRDWNDHGIDLRVAVNLSVRNLYDRDLVPWLSQRLIDWGVNAALLKLEITESQLMDDPMLAMEVLGKMKSLGVSTSIDDFGTGYSSLSYLKNLPIDELKIDRSFVGNMVADDNDLTIVRSTIDLSHNLGLDVVAEGVEDAETLHLLADMGCDRAQGYFISRPVPSDDLESWLRDPDVQASTRRQLTNR
jgi:diguanylate cyclase (GGDEF)-like protein